PELAPLAIDGDPDTGWHTQEYYRRSDLGGLKEGVGLLVDLGDDKVVRSIHLRLGGSPTTVQLLVSRPGTSEPPTSTEELRELGGFEDAKGGEPSSRSRSVLTRYIVVWLTDLPQKSDGVFQGIVREITVRGPA